MKLLSAIVFFDMYYARDASILATENAYPGSKINFFPCLKTTDVT